MRSPFTRRASLKTLKAKLFQFGRCRGKALSNQQDHDINGDIPIVTLLRGAPWCTGCSSKGLGLLCCNKILSAEAYSLIIMKTNVKASTCTTRARPRCRSWFRFPALFR
jgi:hypothetical protein